MTKENTKAEILTTFERAALDAAELARTHAGCWVVAFDDTTPFRIDDNRRIAMCGGRIYTTSFRAIAEQLAKELHAKAQANNATGVVALPVEKWAKERAAHLARLADSIRNA